MAATDLGLSGVPFTGNERYYTGDEARDFARGLRGTVFLDIETAGLGKASLIVKCVSIGRGGEVALLDPRNQQERDCAYDTLLRAQLIVLHNASFDMPILVSQDLASIECCAKVYDTLVISRMAYPGQRNGLVHAVNRVFGCDIKEVDTDLARRYGVTKSELYNRMGMELPLYRAQAAVDVILTELLFHEIQWLVSMDRDWNPVSEQQRQALLDREQKVNRLLLWRSAKGLCVNPDILDTYRDEMAQQQNEWQIMLDSFGISPTRPADLVNWLDSTGHLPSTHPRTATGKPSTSRENLLLLDHPVATAWTRLKESRKVESDYLDKTLDLASCWPDERVHPQVGVLAAATGRISYQSPPLQQFPGSARAVIAADPGDTLVSIDWSQIEPVIMAAVARDNDVLAVYEGGGDLYDSIATAAGVSRKTAKVVLLAQMYGEGIPKLAADLGVNDRTAWKIVDAVFDPMPRTARLINSLRNRGGTTRSVPTISGRVLPIPTSSDGTRVAVHKAVNYFCQGSAYDLLAETLATIWDRGLAQGVYLTMHDELVVSKDIADEVETIMQTPPQRLCEYAGRTPVLRTDRKELGMYWAEA